MSTVERLSNEYSQQADALVIKYAQYYWKSLSVTSLGRPIRLALISGFRSMKRLGVFILPPGWDASPSQGYPQHYAGTHWYTWVERGTVRVKCLAQEHNTMSPARPRTWTTRSGVERTNQEATAPLLLLKRLQQNFGTRKKKRQQQFFELLTIGQHWAGLSYTGSKIINVHKTKEQSDHNNN